MLDLLEVGQLSAPASLQPSVPPAPGPRLSVSTVTWLWTVPREERRSSVRRPLVGRERSVTTSARRMEDVRSFTQVIRTVCLLLPDFIASYSQAAKYVLFFL